MLENRPEVIQSLKTFIEQSTAAAHLRRRSSEMYTNGVTLKDMKSHIKQKFNLTVSTDTVHRWLLPVRKNTTAGKRFKGPIKAKISPKRNSGERKTQPDFHYTVAQVNLVNQLAETCSENTLLLSDDNKNIVEIENPSVSRRCNIRKFYLVEDAPNYNNHDFPFPGTKLTPAGYQVIPASTTTLQQRCNNVAP